MWPKMMQRLIGFITVGSITDKLVHMDARVLDQLCVLSFPGECMVE